MSLRAVLLALTPVLISSLLAAVQMNRPTIENGNVAISFSAEALKQYQLESSAALTGPWQIIGTTQALETVVQFRPPATNSLRYFRIREIGPLQIATSTVDWKAGTNSGAALQANDVGGILSWRLISGVVPEGVTLETNGVLSGVPTAAAAEVGENGIHQAVVEASDLTVPGRSVQRTIRQRVRLSYRLNIHATRPGGPSLSLRCGSCHNSEFAPNMTTGDGSLLIGKISGSGGACGTSRIYVVEGELEESLLYGKMAGPDCGNRMPDGGPYLTAAELYRVARWINEMQFGETD